MHRSTGQEYAVKIVSRRVDCTNEIQLLRLCQGHPNIVQLVDVLQVCIRQCTLPCEMRSASFALRIVGVEGHRNVYMCVHTMTGYIIHE